MNDRLANPAPLGLFGFGMTTVLLNLHNAGFYPLNSMILGMGLAYGGLAQVIAGIMEYKRGNTFGTTAFVSYGLFWWSLVLLLVLPKTKIWEVDAASPLQPATELTGNSALGIFTGYEGIVCGLSAVYTAISEVLNEACGKTILPLYPTQKSNGLGDTRFISILAHASDAGVFLPT